MLNKLKIFLLTFVFVFTTIGGISAFDKKGTSSFITEVKTGVVQHDAGIFGRQKEGGLDSTFEFLFREINYNLFWLGKPRPHFGATINMGGDTSQAYAGVTWDYKLPKRMFFNFSWGLTYHNGDKIHSPNHVQTDKKELGSSLLFREAIEIGWNFYGKDSISLRLDHISNANLWGEDSNEGLDTFGIIYSYRF